MRTSPWGVVLIGLMQNLRTERVRKSIDASLRERQPGLGRGGGLNSLSRRRDYPGGFETRDIAISSLSRIRSLWAPAVAFVLPLGSELALAERKYGILDRKRVG